MPHEADEAILKEKIHRLTGMEHFTDQAMDELMNLPVGSVSVLTSMLNSAPSDQNSATEYKFLALKFTHFESQLDTETKNNAVNALLAPIPPLDHLTTQQEAVLVMRVGALSKILDARIVEKVRQVRAVLSAAQQERAKAYLERQNPPTTQAPSITPEPATIEQNQTSSKVGNDNSTVQSDQPASNRWAFSTIQAHWQWIAGGVLLLLAMLFFFKRSSVTRRRL